MINSISTAALYNAYSTDVGARKVLPTTGEISKKQESHAAAASPTTIVSLSKEAFQALERDMASESVDQFLSDQGQELYDVAIKSLKQYPEDLASRLRDKSLSEQEQTEIHNALTEREMDAFMKYARQDPPDMKMFYEKYIEYLDTLSPEEQQSWRYAGQRELAVPLYEHYARAQGDEPDDMSFPQDPILSLFDLLADIDFKIKDKNGFIKTYEEKITPILNREGNEKLKPLAEEALERLDYLSDVIAAGEAGDAIALEKLNLLANKELSIDDFIRYSKEFTQSKAM